MTGTRLPIDLPEFGSVNIVSDTMADLGSSVLGAVVCADDVGGFFGFCAVLFEPHAEIVSASRLANANVHADPVA